MKISTTPIKDLLLITSDAYIDNRGSFSRVWCAEAFEKQQLKTQFVQSSICHNDKKGTIRGLHFQWPPSNEGKLVRCVNGSVYDVAVDLRPDSATFTQHFALTLNSAQNNALYIPAGFAHGYQTLVDNSLLLYMMSDTYQPKLAGGVHYNDKTFAIDWPLPITRISERDENNLDFDMNFYISKYNQANTRDL
ncbi:dTDP-4-dehydrorhamnose 3,5-epimerase [Paraglaciecola sp. L3A3]|uniref:dTDP-4-dehydrorhamnose 3,5-epimerase n=1 Tax=Paraglaciecola sp. L3A3 TaxID=2686358 RepID=UPI00131C9A3F|nr:dTDP-4-dehydrorhamnose 3,5-epimerase [Paraglaciecola sp. L3A3]